MALAERAELAVRLSLDNKAFLAGLKGSKSALKGMETSLERISYHAGRGLRNTATNLAKIGAVATGFVALNVQRGISSLAELEDATTAVDGAIKQMGRTGEVTSGQIATWANEIETATDAAFDDKEITQAAAGLIRYGKVTTSNLRPALEVMTDLAAKTGDVDSASSLLAKALAAPEKAAGRLARVGVILTEEQQDQIKQMVKVGDTAGAQALLLDALAKSTEGAAKAMHGPYRDAILKMQDATEDAQRVLGEAFLPVIGKVADKLQAAVSDKGFMTEVREFGKTLAGGFDKALEFASHIPWGLIGQSLKTAGQGAKAIFDAFTMLPPWIQQAVITGWGLNKLTGGALGSIVGELGKGLIKGVLGMTAGVVNIKAGVVTGAGGVGGAAGGAAAGGLAYKAGTVIGTVMKVFGVVAIAEMANEFHDEISGLGATLGRQIPIAIAERTALGKSVNDLWWPFGPKGAPSWAGGTEFTRAFDNSLRDNLAAIYPTPAAMREGHGSILTGEQTKAGVDWSSFATKTSAPIVDAIHRIQWKPAGVQQIEDRRGEQFLRTVSENTRSAIDWMRETDYDVVALKASAQIQTTKLEQMKGSIEWGATKTAAEAHRTVEAVSAAKIAQINASDRTTSAVRAIPPPRTTVNFKTNVSTRVYVSGSTYIRALQETGSYSSTQLGAFNKAYNENL